MQPRSTIIASVIGLGLSWSCGQTVPMQEGGKRASVDLQPAVYLKMFAGLKASESKSYSFLPDAALQQIRLEANSPETMMHKQVNRPIVTDRFVQGHVGERVAEDFTVSRLDQLDLLVVVDNSSSMGPYQQKLSVGMSSLLSHISNTDWRMMVTTSSAVRSRDPLNPTQIIRQYGCPRINAQDPLDKTVIAYSDYMKSPALVDKQFAWKVRVGESGDPIEKGVLAAVSGLSGECGDNQRPWTRPDAHKAVFILTDEENCGSDPDQNCDGDADAQPQFFLDRFPSTQFFALLHDNDRYAECSDDGYIRKPNDYRALIASTGGMEGNICKGDYQDILKEISRNIHVVPRIDYPLSFPPVEGTLQFVVNGQKWDAQYSVEGHTVSLFSHLPEGVKTLTIAYNHNPVPVVRQFPLSLMPSEQTLQVRINGDELSSSDYRVEDGQLVFVKKPPDLAKIEARYREAQGLLKSFVIPDQALLGTLEVEVDGRRVEDFKVIGDSPPVLVFEEAPADDLAIQFSYETNDSRKLEYPALGFNQGRIIEVQAHDHESQLPVAVKWDGTNLSFNRDDVSSGRVLDIRYALAPSSEILELSLSQTPLDGSLSIQSSESGSECIAKLTRDASRLLFPCSPETLGRLEIRYDYINQIMTQFRVAGNFTSKARWEVMVDGKAVTDYQRDADKVISFPHTILKADTLIEIKVWEPVRS